MRARYLFAAGLVALALASAGAASAQPSTATGQCAEQEGRQSGDPWSLLSSMAGHYYWFSDPKLPSHSAYLYVHWVTEGQVLASATYTKKGVLEADEYELDAATGKLLVAGNVSNEQYWGVAHRSGACVALYTYLKDMPLRTLLAPEDGGSFALHADKYADGTWQTAGDDEYVATSLDELKAAGLVKGDRR